MAINSVAIVGTGNMAEALIRGFFNSGIDLAGVYGRNQGRLKEIQTQFNVPIFLSIEEVPQNSLVILAVSDDAVSCVSSQFSDEYKLVHTSGSVSMEAITTKNKGVFYPLQTMTSGRNVDLFRVPLFIEANSSELLLDLKVIGMKLTDKIKERNSEQRRKIHLSAVILNNFVTQLVKLSEDYLETIEEKRDILQPLLEETVSKIGDLGAKRALTGPAKRGDEKTIDAHMGMLEGDMKEVYQLMTKIIRKENGKL